jgi:hypothetical protein
MIPYHFSRRCAEFAKLLTLAHDFLVYGNFYHRSGKCAYKWMNCSDLLVKLAQVCL